MGEEVLWCQWLSVKICRSCILKVPADTFTFARNTLKHNPYEGKIGISENKVTLPNCQAHYLSVVFFCLSLSSYSPNIIREQADLLFKIIRWTQSWKQLHDIGPSSGNKKYSSTMAGNWRKTPHRQSSRVANSSPQSQKPHESTNNSELLAHSQESCSTFRSIQLLHHSLNL